MKRSPTPQLGGARCALLCGEGFEMAHEQHRTRLLPPHQCCSTRAHAHHEDESAGDRQRDLPHVLRATYHTCCARALWHHVLFVHWGGAKRLSCTVSSARRATAVHQRLRRSSAVTATTRTLPVVAQLLIHRSVCRCTTTYACGRLAARKAARGTSVGRHTHIPLIHLGITSPNA